MKVIRDRPCPATMCVEGLVYSICENCRGAGHLSREHRVNGEVIARPGDLCVMCKGSGKRSIGCSVCNGRGLVSAEEAEEYRRLWKELARES